MPRGGEWFECDGRAFWWDRCEIPDCPNFVCRGRSDRFCWPHSSSGQTVADLIADLSLAPAPPLPAVSKEPSLLRAMERLCAMPEGSCLGVYRQVPIFEHSGPPPD
jgi:hypothetical protein